MSTWPTFYVHLLIYYTSSGFHDRAIFRNYEPKVYLPCWEGFWPGYDHHQGNPKCKGMPPSSLSFEGCQGDAFLCTMGKLRGLIPIVPVCPYQYSGKLIILVLDISKTFTCTDSQSGLLVPVFAREKSIPFRAETKTGLRTFISANNKCMKCFF